MDASFVTPPATVSAAPAAETPLPLAYPCGEPPAFGAPREIAPGLLWLRMPLPFSLDHINLWLLADEDEHGPGWAVVDTGTCTPPVQQAWSALLAPDGPLAATPQGARLTRVIVTHMHPDHVGMAGWLCEQAGCTLAMSRTEYLSCRVLAADTGRPAPAAALRFFREAGWDDVALQAYKARFGGFGRLIHALPDSYARLVEGQVLALGARRWEVLIGTGHSPEHVCLWSPADGLLIAGDQILPRISSNVSVHPTEPLADPLGDWIGSIERLRARLPAHTLVLPSHGEPFTGVHARLDRLARGHGLGLQRLRERLAAGPLRAVDVFTALFARPIQGGELLGMATGEAVAHLNHLQRRGEITSAVAADGQRWWTMA